MNFRKSREYVKDLTVALGQVKNMEILRNSSVCVSGATGLIGSFIIDMLLEYNETTQSGITVYAMGRSREHFEERFGKENAHLIFIEHDVCYPLKAEFEVHYIIHAASNAYPYAIVNDPVGTILANIIGTKELIDYGRSHGMRKFLYISSGEVYGQIEGKVNEYQEELNGYIDTLNVRSCYPISKRAAENLCISYAKQFGIHVSLVRPSHIYGPNTVKDDNRANVQFVHNILQNQDVVLKSPGNQMRSYTYIADCASAILYVLLNGKNREVYNISNSNSVVSIADFAQALAEIGNKKVIFETPNNIENEQKSPFSRQVLCADKLECLGWRGHFGIDEGLERTLKILRELGCK